MLGNQEVMECVDHLFHAFDISSWVSCTVLHIQVDVCENKLFNDSQLFLHVSKLMCATLENEGKKSNTRRDASNLATFGPQNRQLLAHVDNTMLCVASEQARPSRRLGRLCTA